MGITIFLLTFAEDMTTLLLVRHGETVDNVNRIMQGQTQGRLTDEGRRQARELASVIAAREVSAFISSDLERAVETCRLLMGDNQSEIITTPLLRERDWGSFTGCYIPDLQGRAWTDDIETVEQMKARASEFLRFVGNRYAGKTVVAVGHGIINKAIQSVFFNKEMKDIAPMKNAEIRELHIG